MREFGDHFGAFERIDLATTFRCADRIAAVATDFLLHNPAQIRKTVRARRKADGPTVYVGLPGEQKLSLLKETLDRIAEDASRHDGTSEVLLLGRYRHLRPRNLSALPKQYPSIRFTWMTVHRSKGLEADYAVVLGLCSGKHGFPAEIADDPLLDLVRAAPEAPSGRFLGCSNWPDCDYTRNLRKSEKGTARSWTARNRPTADDLDNVNLFPLAKTLLMSVRGQFLCI